MWFKHRAWIPVLWLSSGANIVAAYYAAMPGEAMHATLHALVAVVSALGAQYLSTRKKNAAGAADADEDLVERVNELESRLADQHQLPSGVEHRLAELEERLDFTERALVDVRNRAQHPPRE